MSNDSFDGYLMLCMVLGGLGLGIFTGAAVRSAYHRLRDFRPRPQVNLPDNVVLLRPLDEEFLKSRVKWRANLGPKDAA